MLVGIHDPRAACDEATARRDLRLPATAPVMVAGPLAAGGAELATADGVTCLLAGRLHNADDLRRDLGLPSGAAATTVVAKAYRRFAGEMLERIRGTFVLVLWDTEHRRGLIAGDQAGPAAVYLHETGGRLTFASELRDLLPLLPRRPRPDEIVIARRAAGEEAPRWSTAFAGVTRLGAGYCLDLGPDDRRRRCYWAPRYRGPLRLDRAEAVEAIREGVTHALRTRLGDSDRVAIMLSGGLDSTLVAAMTTAAVDDARSRVAAYSAVFPDDPALDESPWIEASTGALGMESVRVAVRPTGLVSVVLDYLDAWEEPLTGPGYLLERPLVDLAADAGATAVLDGQGGDELFGHSPLLLADRLARGRVLASVRLARRFPGRDGMPASATRAFRLWRKFAVRKAAPEGVRALSRRRRRQRTEMISWATPRGVQLIADSEHSPPELYPGAPRWWRYSVDILTRVREEMGLFDYVRRRAGIRGLDPRPPFLDADLVELALQVPPDLQFEPLFRPLARELLRGLVPDQVRLRPSKSNLGPFYSEALGQSDLPAVRRLLGPDAEMRAYVAAGRLDEWLEQPASVDPATWLEQMWSLVILECFLRREADPSFGQRLRESGVLSEPAWAPITHTD